MTVKYGLEFLSVASEQVQLRWILGGISDLIGIPKKHLRRAFQVVSTPKLEAEIRRKGKLVRKTFYYGFMSYTTRKKEKDRKILEPHPDVQDVYKGIKVWLEGITKTHERAFGFVKDRNSKKAVEALEALFSDGHHVAFDIADAFPSITDEMVSSALGRMGVDQSMAEVLAWFVTYKYQGERRLPQGASASPLLLNLVYEPMFEEIDLLCSKHGIVWSVYADDFNFAAKSISSEVKSELLAVPTKYGFQIKPKKTKDNFGKTIPHLLGLTIVDGKLHISRKQKKKFRAMIYMAIKYKTYSPEVVRGIMGYIRHIYGEKENWPGWLKRIGG